MAGNLHLLFLSLIFGNKGFLVVAQGTANALPQCNGFGNQLIVPLQTTNLMECVWQVTAPPGQHVRLNVVFMQTDEHEEIAVYDHGTSIDDQYLVSSIRGILLRSSSGNIVSSGAGLTVRYTADQESLNPGIRFFAHTSFVSDISGNELGCGGRIELNGNTVLEAPYNNHIRPFIGGGYMSCVWTVVAPDDRRVRATWTRVDTLDERVGIFDHETLSEDHEVTRLQGLIDWRMPAFTSIGNVIVVYLRQDAFQFVIGNGFSLQLEPTDGNNANPGCGGSLVLAEGTLPTANIRSPYDPNRPETSDCSIMCWWFITAPYGSQVQVDINDVTTTTNERVRITDGATPSNNPSFERTFSGAGIAGETLFSQAGGVTIALEDLSPEGPNGRGFSLDVSIAGPGYCEIMGDPHYTSFDGKRFDFQGDCEYTLLKPRSPETDELPDFHLYGNNVRSSPSSRVSILRQIFLTYNGTTFSVGQPSGRTLRVDGLQVTAPVNQNGVSITYAFPLIIIETEFGLRVTYDGSHFAKVYLSPSFYGKTCGLCGNFDGNPDNDFTLPDGTVTDDVNLFGFKWSTNEEFCVLSSDPTDDPCKRDTALANRIERTCSIFDPDRNEGIFGDCSNFVDHFNFYTSCQFDLCYTHELNKVVCASVQEYIVLCQARNPGVVIGEWRNWIPQCTFDCPEGTGYRMCGTACPNTCADPTAADNCPRPCHETCLCPDGLVLDGEKCVEIADCGCTLPNNVYISSGEVWITPDTCEERCDCQGGILTCEPLGCGDNEVCAVRNGVRGCYCQDNFILNPSGECVRAPAVCTISGDPHYRTFDRFYHHFQGDCMYTLVKPCQASDLFPDFHIWGDPVKTHPSATVSWLRKVFLLLNGTTYTLGQGMAFLVDGVAQSNIDYRDGSVHAWADSRYLTLETEFGVRIQFSGGSLAEISVSYDFWNNTCGLCGNFDGISTNEFTTSDGTLTGNVDEFGNSWQTGSEECQGIDTPQNPCDVDQDMRTAAARACNNLQNINGPFQNCLDFADPTDIYTSCLFDACVLGADDDAVCDHYDQYTGTCQALGQQPATGGVLSHTFPCPEPQLYNPCGSPCPATCANPTAPENCQETCIETCSCPDGLLLDGDSCVEPDRCGCTYEGSYYPNGATWTSVDCSSSCSCVSREVVCNDNYCHPGEECVVDAQGVPGCYCRRGLSRVDGACVGEIPPAAEIRVVCDNAVMSAGVNGDDLRENIQPNDFPVGGAVCGVFTYGPTSFTFEKFFESCDAHIAATEGEGNDVIFADVATAPLDVITVGATNPDARTVIFCEFRPQERLLLLREENPFP
ncbi:zonadhesin-like [Lytechinus variegatus]|uniref:zonadhesin-like n=1 Tax=Lytechinus variegatus TaxID=7654 RepID=UPI001BB2C19E|nr:zonadhesin-like [Lytechinus variegatus]